MKLTAGSGYLFVQIAVNDMSPMQLSRCRELRLPRSLFKEDAEIPDAERTYDLVGFTSWAGTQAGTPYGTVGHFIATISYGENWYIVNDADCSGPMHFSALGTRDVKSLVFKRRTGQPDKERPADTAIVEDVEETEVPSNNFNTATDKLG